MKLNCFKTCKSQANPFATGNFLKSFNFFYHFLFINLYLMKEQ